MSLGDSYALGIAGTGGTYSSSSWVDELWEGSGLGAGSRDVPACEFRCAAGTADVLVVVKLPVEVTERPEL